MFVQKLGELPYCSCAVTAQANIIRRPTSLLQEIHKLTPYGEVITAHDPVCFFIKFGTECVQNGVIFTLYAIVTNLDILGIEIQLRHNFQRC